VTPTPSDRVDRGRVALLGLASGLSAFGMASVIPSLPIIGRAFGADYASLQWVVSAYLLGLGLAQPMQGWFCDRFGRRPVMLGGFALFVIASLAASMAPSLGWLVVARFAQSLGVSVATVVSRAIVRDTHSPEGAAVALSFITAVMGIAPVVAPLAGGVVVAAFDWHALFLLHAGLALALWLGLALLLRETRPDGTQQLSATGTLRAFWELVRTRSFLALSLVYSFTSAAAFAFITCGAALYERLFGMSPSAFGAFWAGLALAYALGAAVAGVSARRFGAAHVLVAGTALAACGGLAFVTLAWLDSESFIGYACALGIQLFANGVVSPLSLAGAVNERPLLAGTASGLSSAIAMLVSMVFAIAAGAAFNGTAISIAWLLALGTVLAVVAAASATRQAIVSPPNA
jgi:MFS transporter, DHA1 family, multidrug resistance protein